MSTKNSACSVYGMDAFYPGVHSPSDWISCLLFGKGLERSRRSQKIAKAIRLHLGASLQRGHVNAMAIITETTVSVSQEGEADLRAAARLCSSVPSER